MDNIPKEVFQDVLKETCRIHEITSFKPLQELCIRNLLDDRDVFACFPTGFGKSLVFQTWPTVCSLLEQKLSNNKWPIDGILIVICPLLSFMEDQVKLLTSKGISAAYIGKGADIDERISRGEYSIVFGSPESFVGNNYWRNVLQTPIFQRRLIGMAANEVHTVVQWGQGKRGEAPFRKWCGLVGELRSLLPKSTPVFATTATASKRTRRDVIKQLGISGCIVIAVSPHRPNIRFAAKKVSDDPQNTFAWLCEELKEKGPNADKVVIYCKSISDCSLLYADVFKPSLGKKFCYPLGANDVSSNRLVDMYHSETSDDVKKDISNSLKDPASTLRVVIATSALGMGVDFRGVQMVVHYGPPRELDDFMQAIGRAGRDGADSHSIILYHGKQRHGLSHQMQEYLSTTMSCRRVKLHHLFDEEKVAPISPGHRCCDVCATSCECADTVADACDGKPSEMEKHAGEQPVCRQRSVSDAQKQELQMRLESLLGSKVEPAAPRRVSVYTTTSALDTSNSELITEVLDNSCALFTWEDIFCNTPVSNLKQAQSILAVLSDVFHDIEQEDVE